MSKVSRKKLLSDLINEIDYDIWKDYFVPGYAEEPEWVAESLERLDNILREYLYE